MRWNCMLKARRLVHITVEHQDCQFFTVFLTIKTSSQNITITLLQISLKLHEHRGGYWKKKLQWTILEEQFPGPRNTAVSKIGNGVISLLCQLRCPCNPDHNKVSSLSKTTVLLISQNLCKWRRSSRSHLGVIDPEKLYRATLRVSKNPESLSLRLSLCWFTSSAGLPVFAFFKDELLEARKSLKVFFLQPNL